MKNILISIIVLVTSIGASVCNSIQEELTIVTFNIRYDNPADGINRWEARSPIVQNYFSDQLPDIIGMQEVLHNQLLDLLMLVPGYEYIGTGRDDGNKGGEYSPIFYRKDKFNLLDDGQFWLSETPAIPGSKSWDAAITRIVTWGKFESIETGNVFYCFNTHFDHRGVQARQMSTDLMSTKISEIAGDNPTIAMGDFNIRKNHATLGRALYYNLIGRFKDDNLLMNAEYISKDLVTTAGATGNGFRSNWSVGEPGDAIDYVFVNPHFDVEYYWVDRVLNGEVFISDHWPVVAKIRFIE